MLSRIHRLTQNQEVRDWLLIAAIYPLILWATLEWLS